MTQFCREEGVTLSALNYWRKRFSKHSTQNPLTQAVSTDGKRNRVDAYNAVAEGINSNIMSIKRRAGGYRNPENFKKAIFFYCGGLDLYPG
jgi:hypothetical protein